MGVVCLHCIYWVCIHGMNKELLQCDIAWNMSDVCRVYYSCKMLLWVKSDWMDESTEQVWNGELKF